MSIVVTRPTAPQRSFSVAELTGVDLPRSGNAAHVCDTDAKWQTFLATSAIDGIAVAPGDDIILTAGVTYTAGSLPAIANAPGQYIRIRSSEAASLPPPGFRVDDLDILHMPKFLIGPTSFELIASGCSYYRLEGLYIARTNTIGGSSVDGWLVVIGDWNHGFNWTEAELPNHVILDRCYLDGDTNFVGSYRSIVGVKIIAGNWIAVVNSVVTNIYAGFEGQCINYITGSGPLHIENNLLEGFGENVMVGGSEPGLGVGICSDIKVLRNHFRRPAKWNPDCIDGSVATPTQSVNVSAATPAVVTVNAGTPAWLTSLTGVDGTAVGDLYFQIGTLDYTQSLSRVHVRVASIDSDTQLTLADAYPGAPFTATPYNIGHWDGVPHFNGAQGYADIRNGKCLLEFKFGVRALVEGNVFENQFGSGQIGTIAMNHACQHGSVRDSYPWLNFVELRDIEIRYSWSRHSNGIMYIASRIDNTAMPAVKRIWVHDNLNELVSNKFANTLGAFYLTFNAATQSEQGHVGAGGFQQASDGGILDEDWAFEHNLVIKKGYDTPKPAVGFTALGVASQPVIRHVVRDNIWHTDYGTSSPNCGGNGWMGSVTTPGEDGTLWTIYAGDETTFEHHYNIHINESGHATAETYHNPRRTDRTIIALASVTAINWRAYAAGDYTIDGDLYATGLVTVANTGADLYGDGACGVVTLTGGTFPASIVRGVPFRVVGHSWGIVDSRDSGTQLTLTAPYDVIASATAYTLTFKGYSSNGADPGPDMAALVAATAGVIAGTPLTGPPPVPISLALNAAML